MEVNTLVNTIREGVTNNANVKAIFGEPITAQGKTIIPVARIGYGFGGGSGTKGAKDPLAQGETGGGGGGGGKVIPIGVVEVTEAGTRYIPFFSGSKLVVAVAIGLMLGMWMGRRRGRPSRYR